MAEYRLLDVKVSGEFACFTRPELKVERVSYPVMTPSAARGVLESIFWKPEFTWQVEEIAVLKPVQFFSFRRNEVKSRAVERTVRGWVETGGGFNAPDDRTQRNTLALHDVAYIIRARPEPHSGTDADRAKYRDQFRRRVERGQCYHQPYLGCREFPADFAPPTGNERPIAVSGQIGQLLRDIVFTPRTPGFGEPHFFTASLDNGVMRVPPLAGEER